MRPEFVFLTQEVEHSIRMQLWLKLSERLLLGELDAQNMDCSKCRARNEANYLSGVFYQTTVSVR